MLITSLALGAAVLLAVVALYGWAGSGARTDGEIRALAFCAIVIGNLALIFANRARSVSLLATLARPNPALWWIAIGTLGALAVSLYVPPVAAIFRFTPPAAGELALAAAAGLAGVLCMEVWKGYKRHAAGTGEVARLM
jgi:Ca2+-transporting ATPase